MSRPRNFMEEGTWNLVSQDDIETPLRELFKVVKANDAFTFYWPGTVRDAEHALDSLLNELSELREALKETMDGLEHLLTVQDDDEEKVRWLCGPSDSLDRLLARLHAAEEKRDRLKNDRDEYMQALTGRMLAAEAELSELRVKADRYMFLTMSNDDPVWQLERELTQLREERDRGIPRAELERALAAAQAAIHGYGKLAEDYETLEAERDRLLAELSELREERQRPTEERCPTCGSDNPEVWLTRCQERLDAVAEMGGSTSFFAFHSSTQERCPTCRRPKDAPAVNDSESDMTSCPDPFHSSTQEEK